MWRRTGRLAFPDARPSPVSCRSRSRIAVVARAAAVTAVRADHVAMTVAAEDAMAASVVETVTAVPGAHVTSDPVA
jgi:hypothetical protein